MLAELRFDYKNKESGYRYQVELTLMGVAQEKNALSRAFNMA